MDADLRRRVDALRRPLELAAADGFAGVRRVAGLGNALRAACDGLIAKLAASAVAPDPRAAADDTLARDPRAAADDALAQWRATLGRWEQLGEHQQAVEVARGMRLLARFPSAPAGRPARASEAPITAAPPRVAYPPPPKAPGLPQAAPAGSSSRAGVAPAPRKSLAQRADKVSAPVPRADKVSALVPRADKVSVPAAAVPAERAKKTRASAKRSEGQPAHEAAPANESLSAKESSPANESSPAKMARASAKPAEEPSDPLSAPTHSLPGIGPAFAERLAEKGLETVEDLLWCLPRRYDDVRDARPLAEVCRMEEGCLVCGS